MNTSEAMRQAHAIARKAYQVEGAIYSECLGKAITKIYAKIKEETAKAMRNAIKQSALFSRVGIKKSAEEISAKTTGGKFFIENCASDVINGLSNVIVEQKARAKKAEIYYAKHGRHVTMC